MKTKGDEREEVIERKILWSSCKSECVPTYNGCEEGELDDWARRRNAKTRVCVSIIEHFNNLMFLERAQYKNHSHMTRFWKQESEIMQD